MQFHPKGNFNCTIFRVFLPLLIYHVFIPRIQVKSTIFGVQASGIGLDFSVAKSITFVELPKFVSKMLQVSLQPLNWFRMDGYLLLISFIIEQTNVIQSIVMSCTFGISFGDGALLCGLHRLVYI